MEQAIEGKLKEEHAKRIAENEEATELYDALVNEKGDDVEDADHDSDFDDDMDGEGAEIMRRMAESRYKPPWQSILKIPIDTTDMRNQVLNIGKPSSA
jgi:hypothetical protein